MPAPTPPYIDVHSGFVVYAPGNSTIAAGSQFYWYNSNSTGINCTVSASWCSVPPAPGLSPGQYWQATVNLGLATGSYNWSSACCASAQPAHIQGGHVGPGGKKK